MCNALAHYEKLAHYKKIGALRKYVRHYKKKLVPETRKLVPETPNKNNVFCRPRQKNSALYTILGSRIPRTVQSLHMKVHGVDVMLSHYLCFAQVAFAKNFQHQRQAANMGPRFNMNSGQVYCKQLQL